ncbi:hypothetical protein [Segetibacter aerophilus]|uniref:Uncharacterized protein n=1 Tax=Segetibacter aerophilus TaxID=670293 RepID=A0A512B8Y4_9BACT|nr:hypothetical protein [Segetibacter aerophilus]GEO08287.1 hypothetical protein SAE01_07830 [Segetibacter aerophilus]
MIESLIIATVIISIIGCKAPTTEEKLKEAVENLKSQQYKDIEYIKVDSIRYSLGSLSGIHTYNADFLKEHLDRLRDLRESARLTHSNPLIVELSHRIMKTRRHYEFLLQEAGKPDTSTKVYNLDYNILIKSPSQSKERREKAFLYAINLQPVRINIDSLFFKATNYKDEYDSSSELSVLKMNTELEVKRERLQYELRMDIARGMNRGVILQYELEIAKLRSQIAHNKMKYYWLYD